MRVSWLYRSFRLLHIGFLPTCSHARILKELESFFSFLGVVHLSSCPPIPLMQVSGMIKSIFGLSSAVLSVLYAGLFGASDVGKFLLLLSVGVPVLGMLSSIPINLVPAKHLGYATERAQGVSNSLSEQRERCDTIYSANLASCIERQE